MTAGAALPPLREEVSLHPGPEASDGWPTWTLRDPVRNRFFRIDWPSFEMLSRWHLGAPEAIAQAVSAETTLEMDADDVIAVARVLDRSHLLRPQSRTDLARLAAASAAERPSWGEWLLHHYLFFRIPLVRPDRWLSRTLPLVRWAGGRGFSLVTLFALLGGLALLARDWDRFATTLLDTFTTTGAAIYAMALAGAKVVHELAHAYTARAKGCRVPTMGVAFLVMWPVLYTDVNESWLLPRRRDRLAVGSAGIRAELTLAAWATLAWGLLADGPLRQAAFVLATTTWITSILMNMSPFMRFDGYFLLMDTLNLPNLHPRSFAIARWRLREVLFDLGEPPPEPFLPTMRRALTLFAVGVWIYRLVVFLGIAALVYHFFFKLVGIGLFIVEIGWFVVLPVWNELKEWRRRGRALLASRRSRFSLLAAGLAMLATVVPMQGRIAAPAVFQAAEHRPLFPPAPAQVEAVLAANGQKVAAGDVLFRLVSPDVAHRAAQAARKIAVLDHELGASGFDPSLQSHTQSLKEELASAVAERLGAERETEQLTVTAPMAGIVVDMMPDLAPGQWLSPKDRLAAVAGDGPAVLTAYVGEDEVERLSIGAEADFLPTAPGRATVSGTVTAIERTALHQLDVPSLASVAGGPIAVRPGDRTLTPEKALYRVRLTTTEPPPAQELVGTMHIDAAGATLVARAWRSTLGILVRESGM